MVISFPEDYHGSAIRCSTTLRRCARRAVFEDVHALPRAEHHAARSRQG